MSLIGYALRMAKQYYNIDTYNHALRVASFVADNSLIPENLMDISISLAIMHDLIEDTIYDQYNTIPCELNEQLNLLSKKNNESYNNYIQRISLEKEKFPEVYWVKIADIKDHLSQKETLSDKLKEKYLSALPYLL